MFNSLKNLIQADNERVIVVENGKPAYVLLTFEEYQQLRNAKKSSIINQSIGGVTARDEEFGGEVGASQNLPDRKIGELNKDLQNIDSEEGHVPNVKIEDLPF